MIAAFLDTNIYLHYEMVDQIDWCSILGDFQVTLVLLPITFRELNKRKDAPGAPRVRARAGKALARIDALLQDSLSAEVRAGVTLSVVPHDPSIDFRANRLHPDVQDDWLLASALEYRVEHPTVATVVVTADTGLRYKVRGHQLTALQMPESLRLPDEPDEQGKLMRQLEARVRELEKALPQPGICFSDDTDTLDAAVRPALQLRADRVERVLAQLSARFPRYPDSLRVEDRDGGSSQKVQVNTLTALAAAYDHSGVSVGEIRRYNAEREEYLQTYVRWLDDLAVHRSAWRRSVVIDLRLFNLGGAPVDNVDVLLHFPDHAEPIDPDDLPRRPDAPLPPQLPRGPVPFSVASLLSTPPAWPEIPADLIAPGVKPRLTGPFIRRVNSYAVEYSYDRLRHGSYVPLPRLIVRFASFDDATNFAIDWTIHADNLPEPTSGQLLVCVRKIHTL